MGDAAALSPPAREILQALRRGDPPDKPGRKAPAELIDRGLVLRDRGNLVLTPAGRFAADAAAPASATTPHPPSIASKREVHGPRGRMGTIGARGAAARKNRGLGGG